MRASDKRKLCKRPIARSTNEGDEPCSHAVGRRKSKLWFEDWIKDPKVNKAFRAITRVLLSDRLRPDRRRSAHCRRKTHRRKRSRIRANPGS